MIGRDEQGNVREMFDTNFKLCGVGLSDGEAEVMNGFECSGFNRAAEPDSQLF